MSVAARTYTAYGADAGSADAARLAYTGEIVERLTGWYLLGGRPYNPVLRRFLVPDPESPFHEGGFNRYAYCSGDPVNRIDPSGNAWTDWLAAGLMVALSVVGTVISAGTLAAPLAAASTAVATAAVTGAGVAGAASAAMAVAAATPGIVATATAVTMDVISTAAAIGSIASMAAHNQKANAILGWVAMGAGVASGASTLVASKQISKASTRASFATRGTPTGSRASRTTTTHATVSAVKTAMPTLTSSASGRSDRRGSTRSLVTSDASGNLPQVRRASADLSTNGDEPSTFYVGTLSMRRAFRKRQGEKRNANKPFRQDIEGVKRASASVGLNVEAIDMTRETTEQIRRRLSEDGIHVVVSGHGLLDEPVMRSLNMPSAVSDHLIAVRASR
ncbi:RHS repeat-associated protein [Luteibacter jiangsuensis]|uniref:RHS repeat-associated protein n=1 Tax=Luteibacter jiangsuensis TaxID=637577 RepID=A0ABT9T1M1_9GAMM|nr:RHS repeat-associated core domain-containing protein [Luteibacter jiangsuensis]MDQ0011173.1 RHS repeat-associated protein [Luteibacter jiangsuensis]